MTRQITCILLILSLCIHLHGQQISKERACPQGKLQISSNGRFLIYENGEPFFYFGDTAWSLFHRLNEEEVELYFENRRAKGFTVIQAVILAELDGLNTPNRNGDRPFVDNDPAKPNEKYFRWIDNVLKMAEAKGLYVGLLPTWGDKVDKQWGVGPEIFNEENIRVYGEFLGRRYKDCPNIIWINGGDRQGGGRNFPIWDVLGKAIKSEDKNHLMTYHPSGEASSSTWFHNCDWLDFNSIQTSHSHTSYEIYERLLVGDYNLTPVKPTIDLEPRYETIPIDFKEENGRFDDADVRKSLYWTLFCGGFGYTYGANDIWQFYTPDVEPMVAAQYHWMKSLDLPGASSIIHAKNLLAGYDFLSRVPDQSIIVSKQHDKENMAVATRGNGYAFIYLPLGNEIEVSLEKISNTKKVKLIWYNPRNGEETFVKNNIATGNIKLQALSSGKGNDWILIIERIK